MSAYTVLEGRKAKLMLRQSAHAWSFSALLNLVSSFKSSPGREPGIHKLSHRLHAAIGSNSLGQGHVASR